MHSYVLYQVPLCFTSGSPSSVHLFYREDNLYLFHPCQLPSAELHHIVPPTVLRTCLSGDILVLECSCAPPKDIAAGPA